MKFLVITKSPDRPGGVPPEPRQARTAKDRLAELIKSGTVERAFAIHGGGAAFIVNAPSQGLVSKNTREHPLSLRSEIEVLPLRDFEPIEPTSP